MNVSASTSDRVHPRFEPTGTVEVPVFYPTLEEMKDFPGYINKIEQEHHAHLICGIAKIVPPKGYRQRKSGDFSDLDTYMIDQPVKEKIQGHGGIYTKTNRLFRRSISVRDFRALAKKMPFPRESENLSPQEIEKFYWKHVLQGEPVYGADTQGTICDKDLKEFNMNHLGTVLDLLDQTGIDERLQKANVSRKIIPKRSVKIRGVNTVYLYFGMWKTTFPWHPEDMDLYSINYVHFGAPKFWYAVASNSLNRFERFAAHCFPSEAKHCKSFLRHKTFMISPQLMKKCNVDFGTMIQYAGEFIITFPRGYHMGFNTGYNCAESTNFATDRWIDFGKNALVCTCRSDSVEIDMRPFMEAYRPDECKEWFQYWYGERPVKEKKKEITMKRQPIYDEKAVEKKKRRKEQKSGGTRGPHVEDQNGSDSGMSDVETDDVSGYENEMTRMVSEMIVNTQWKKEARDLWSNLPANLFAEKDYNNRRSYDAPHCAVCQYFVPKPLMERSKTLPSSSKRIIRRAHYAKVDPETYPIQNDDIDEERLFRCANCLVVVHEGCYPIGNIPKDMKDWRCVRCRQKDDLSVRSASCHLCELRGGALIPAEESGGDFVHVICALLNRRTIFPDPVRLTSAYTVPPPKFRAPSKYPDRLAPEYLEAFGENTERGKFECEYCLLSREGLLKCLVCDETLFHATCGRMAGVSFEFRNWPDLAIAVCPEHNEVEENPIVVAVGDKVRVFADASNGRLLKGTVTRIDYQDCCTVNFLDRNWSDDLPTADILECECSKMNCGGWHVPGAKIKMRWDDDMIYEGVFRNRYRRATYTIRIASKYGAAFPSVLQVSRDAVFARGEKPCDE